MRCFFPSDLTRTHDVLRLDMGYQGYAPYAWTSKITAFINSISSKQLTMAGDDGFWEYKSASSPSLPSRR